MAMAVTKDQVISAASTPRVQRYRTRLAVTCLACKHQGTVAVFLDKPPKLVCSKCGSRDATVAGRDTMRAMKKQVKKPEPSYGTAFSG